MIDPVTDTVVWGMELTGHEQCGRRNHEVRPMAFEANPDGSTKRMFAQATGINAVWVIDWTSRKVVDMLWPPALPAWKQNADGIQTGDMHGLEVLPNRSAVWASSRLDSRIYGWTLPGLKYIGAVEVGPTANWMTPTPDSRFMSRRGIRRRLHRGRGPAEAAGCRQDQGRRATGADQHGDPAAEPRQCPAGTSGPVLRHFARDITAGCHRRRPGGRRRPASAGATDVEFFRKNIEPLFMRGRGGTMPGYASCVMCHTWQTKLRFRLADA